MYQCKRADQLWLEVVLEGMELVGYEASFDFCSETDSNSHAEHQMKFLKRNLNYSQVTEVDHNCCVWIFKKIKRG